MAHRLINLLYPPACLVCKAALPDGDAAPSGQAPLCGTCVDHLPWLTPPRCRRCDVPLAGAFDAAVECAACRLRPPAFDAAGAPWRYARTARLAVRQFKYHRRRRLGPWLAEQMVRTAREALSLDAVDVVVPVPLHWLNARWRGSRTTETLAGAVAQILGKPCRPRALRRIRWTASQTRHSRAGRIRNVRDAFRARPPLVAGRAVLLVDDVLTSGATASACARALKAAGASRVLVLTACRTALQ